MTDDQRPRMARWTVAMLAVVALIACHDDDKSAPAKPAMAGAWLDQGESRAPYFVGPAPTSPPRRMVSLAPSVTEILFALGAGDRLVGVTRFCDYPPQAKTKTKIGGFLDPSLEAIAALKPDLIVAVPNGQNRPVIERLVEMGYPALIVFAYELKDVDAALAATARVLGLEPAARALSSQLTADIAAVRTAVRDRPRPRVLFLYGHRPLVAAGAHSYADALLEIAGGVNVAASGITRYPTLSVETVIGYAPDVILDAYSAGMGGSAQPSVLERFDTIPAVKEGRVHRLADNAALRPGPRAGQDARLIARLLHPDIKL